MNLTYSQTGDALYISLRDGRPTHGEEIDSGTIVDLDEAGIVGIEVLNPAREWPLEAIAERFGLAMDDVLKLKAALWPRRGGGC